MVSSRSSSPSKRKNTSQNDLFPTVSKSFVISAISLAICVLTWSYQSNLIQTLQIGQVELVIPDSASVQDGDPLIVKTGDEGESNINFQESDPSLTVVGNFTSRVENTTELELLTGNLTIFKNEAIFEKVIIPPFIKPYFITWFSYSFLALLWVIMWTFQFTSSTIFKTISIFTGGKRKTFDTNSPFFDSHQGGLVSKITFVGLMSRIYDPKGRYYFLYDCWLVFTYLFANYLFNLSFIHTSLPESVAIASTSCFISHIVAVLMGKEKATREKSIATMFAFLSCLLMIFVNHGQEEGAGSGAGFSADTAHSESSSQIYSFLQNYYPHLIYLGHAKGNWIAFLGALFLSLHEASMISHPVLSGCIPFYYLKSAMENANHSMSIGSSTSSDIQFGSRESRKVNGSQAVVPNRTRRTSFYDWKKENDRIMDRTKSAYLSISKEELSEAFPTFILLPNFRLSWPWYLSISWRAWLGSLTLLLMWIPIPILHFLSIERFDNFFSFADLQGGGSGFVQAQDGIIKPVIFTNYILPLLLLNGILTFLHSICELSGTLLSGTAIFSALCGIFTIPVTMLYTTDRIDFNDDTESSQGYDSSIVNRTSRSLVLAFFLLLIALYIFIRKEWEDHSNSFLRFQNTTTSKSSSPVNESSHLMMNPSQSSSKPGQFNLTNIQIINNNSPV